MVLVDTQNDTIVRADTVEVLPRQKRGHRAHHR